MAASASASASASTTTTTTTPTTTLLWYRPFDLRTDDHPALLDASASSDRLLPIYCLDEERELCPAPSNAAAAVASIPPLGPHRLRFRLEALSDLRASLAALSSGLVVRSGAPEEVLPRVLEEIVEASGGGGRATVSLVFHRRPPAPPLPPEEEEDDDDDDENDGEELRVANALARACERLGLPSPSVRRHWGAATLHHPTNEVAAWLSAGAREEAPSARPPPPASTAPVADADGPGAAEEEERLLLRLLPDTFSAYKRALEAGAPSRPGGDNPTKTKTKTKHQPPLRAWLPSADPSPAPKGPLPPLPPPFDSNSNDSSSLPQDTHDLYAEAGALDALNELSRLCGGVDFGPGAVVPAYACADGDKEREQRPDGGLRHPRADPRSAFPFVGGERAARARLDFVLRSVLHQSSSDASPTPLSYGKARMMAAGAESAKLSPYLSSGCLSPRRVAAELALRRRRGDSEEDDSDARWLLMHLVIRDWYVLSGWREAAIRARRRRGDERRPPAAPSSVAAFEGWARGSSDFSPFVDAAMRELAATGWQSNRSRQVAASALAHDLLPKSGEGGEGGGGAGDGWWWGARLFESLLIDGDLSANRGNWQSVCARRFDPEAQRAKYDPEGLLERAWLS